MSRPSRLSRPLTLLLSVFCLAPVLAAPPTNAEKTYRIEAIVFAQPGNAGTDERWPTTATLPPALETITPAADLPADAKLMPALQALRSSAYRVLAQATWTQAPTDKAVTKPIAIRNADGTLDGTVLFYVSRFLHSEIDLRWRGEAPEGAPAAPTTAFATTDDPANPPTSAPAASQITAAPAVPVYRLSERRRIRTAETHYFDHPKFGVLLRVTPL